MRILQHLVPIVNRGDILVNSKPSVKNVVHQVYVDNLEKRCKKMERLLTQLTNTPIKDLERTDFRHQRTLSDPSVSSSDDSDDEQQQETNVDDDSSILDRLAHLDIQDYDSLKYTGQSAGLLNPQDIFNEQQPTIAWPGRQDMVLQKIADDQLMVVRTEKSTRTGKLDTRLDIGISINSAITIDSPLPTPSFLVNPSKTLINQMIQLYFTHLHTSLPIINKTRFLHLYNTQSPTLPKILIQAVLAVSFRFSSIHHPSLCATAEQYSDHYFRKVMKHLRDPARSRLCHVQAGLLATLYLDMDDDDVESIQWHTLGKSIRMAQDLGLHRSCEHWQLPPCEVETRHRVFYACYALDRWIGARAGKPLTILDRDFDTTLPSMYDNESGPPVYRAFVLWVKLAEIVGRVLKALYAPSAKKANSNANLDDPMILVVFDRRLKHWYSLMEESVDGVPLPMAQKASLQIYYNTVILLLRRPFLSISKYLTLEHLVTESRQVSLKAASDLSKLMQQSNNQVNIWSSLLLPTCYIYAMFLSSLAHLAIVLHHQSCPDKRAALMESIQLVESHHHLPSSRRALEILNMLITIHDLNNKMIDNTRTTTMTIKMENNNELDQLGSIYHQQDHSSLYSTPTTTMDPSLQPRYLQTTTAWKEGEMPKTHWFQRYVNTSVVGGVPVEIQQDVQSDLTQQYMTSYHQPPLLDSSILMNDSISYTSFMQPSTLLSTDPPPPLPQDNNNISPSNLNLHNWQYYMATHPPPP
ncbi:fungal-specific transcription factor domain-containing protein [Chlamydoabsidia padenii]|nr:fungal-specific transcription factor domain-containing protein [Chlamydoabsidia padenii]